MCYNFDGIIKFEDFDFDNILIGEKSHEKILIYNISYKSVIGAKPLRITFDKIDGFSRVYDGSRYLVLFGLEKDYVIYNRFRYLIRLKGGIKYVFSHYHAKIEVNSNDSLHLEKTLILHDVIIHIKPVLNKDQNHYYYNILLEKCSYELAKK